MRMLSATPREGEEQDEMDVPHARLPEGAADWRVDCFPSNLLRGGTPRQGPASPRG